MAMTVLISSAAYVEPELEAEFGRVPPAFLPLGNRRLFVHQRAVLGQTDARVLLSLPEDFVPDAMDADLLRRLGIETVTVPAGLSLGQSVVYVINMTAASGARLRLLHGDTLIRGIDLAEDDAVSVSGDVPAGYRWGYVDISDGRLSVREGAASALSGYFAFRDAGKLVQSITRQGGRFLQGLADYSTSCPMRAAADLEWHDFGHVNTYYQSRRAVTTQRAFNTLAAGRRAVSKSGSDARKIEAEARWFEALPPGMRLYAPAYLGTERAGAHVSYGLEYLHLPTLAELFVFGRLPDAAWRRILHCCAEFLDACAGVEGPPGAGAAAQSLFGDKTVARLERFARETGTSLSAPCRFDGRKLPSLERIAMLASAAVPDEGKDRSTLVHGDFCFSNILYDSRADGIKVIDPRGLDAAGGFSAFGDIRYDIGKLYHSAVGKYDFILAGYYELRRDGALDFGLTLPDSDSARGLARAMAQERFAGFSADRVSAHAIAVLLFLSMLPLHADDPARQAALLANALRLFALGLDGQGT